MNVSVHWRKDPPSPKWPAHWGPWPDHPPELDVLVSDEKGFGLFTFPYREVKEPD